MPPSRKAPSKAASKSTTPPIPRDLVEWLDRTYPERCPSTGDTLEDIWRYAGARHLVRALLAEHQRQNTP
jgi:hypothetical protein